MPRSKSANVTRRGRYTTGSPVPAYELADGVREPRITQVARFPIPTVLRIDNDRMALRHEERAKENRLPRARGADAEDARISGKLFELRAR
jgi:hypothetical protein